MKDRIAQIMKSEKMTQQDFAAALDISPSTLSSIFNERTQPSLTIVYKILERFPNINIDWLLNGRGEMYKTPETTTASPENDGTSGIKAPLDLFGNSDENNEIPPKDRIVERVKYIDKPQRRITEISVYFDDGTYEVFVPRKRE